MVWLRNLLTLSLSNENDDIVEHELKPNFVWSLYCRVLELKVQFFRTPLRNSCSFGLYLISSICENAKVRKGIQRALGALISISKTSDQDKTSVLV